jgi:putative transcriptional regulator
MKSAYDKIAAGMDDAIAFARGDAARGRIHEPVDVKAIRQAARMSQAEFAQAFRLPLSTVREWEQKRRKPEAPARVLLSMIAADPGAVREIIERAE